MSSEEIEKTEVEPRENAAANIDEADIDEVDIGEANKNLAEIDRAEEQEQAAAEDNIDEQIRNNMLRNVTFADADMRMFGDRTVLAQVAQLMAYIRHAVKSGQPTEIKLLICKSDSTVSGAEFVFDLNGCQVPDLAPQKEIFIN